MRAADLIIDALDIAADGRFAGRGPLHIIVCARNADDAIGGHRDMDFIVDAIHREAGAIASDADIIACPADPRFAALAVDLRALVNTVYARALLCKRRGSDQG